MPRLTANYSEALRTLRLSNNAPVDGIEVGPWFQAEEVRRMHEEFPDWKIQFHAGSFMTRFRYWNGALDRLAEYNACTQSEWVSLHIELLPIGVFLMSERFGINLNPPDIEKAKDKFIRFLFKIKDEFDLPIILENLPSLPQGKYAYAANPAIISDIIRSTDSGFLLDIAHVRIAASYQGLSVENYLEKLPLEKTEQVHVSGARMKNGFLKDAHETIQEEDYDIIKLVLEKCEPKVVTLEYFREPGPLREQLWRLREIIPG